MIFSLVSCVVVATPLPLSGYPCLPDDGTRQHSRRALFAVGDIVGQRRLRQLIDHDHLDRVVLSHVVADPDALCAALTAVDGDIGGSVLEALVLPHLITVENGVGLRTILRAELAALGRANFDTDISNKIHSAP